MRYLAAGMIVLLAVGCTSRSDPEHITLRETMDQGTRTIRREHMQWAKMLTVDPVTGTNAASLLPKLTPFDFNNRLKAHEEYNELVNEDRQRDPTPSFKSLTTSFDLIEPVIPRK